jgi:hypothetical protein
MGKHHLPLQGFQIGNEILGLIRIEPEFGHHRMTSLDSLPKGLCKVLDRVAKMEIAEWGSELLRAVSRFQNGMTSRAMLPREDEPEPDAI